MKTKKLDKENKFAKKLNLISKSTKETQNRLSAKGGKINNKSNKKQQQSSFYENEDDLEFENAPKNFEEIDDFQEEEIENEKQQLKKNSSNKKGIKEAKPPKGKNRKTKKNAFGDQEEEELIYDFYKPDVNLSLQEDEQSEKNNFSNKSFSQDLDFEQTKHERTIIIKNLARTVDEEELKDFLEENSPDVKPEDLRVVRDNKGFSKGFAFVDFFNKYDAEICLENINEKEIEGEFISCAISKPPSSG